MADETLSQTDCAAREGECEGCNRRALLVPLHGEKGGPLRCFVCAGAWHAEHGRRRKMGRVVIRAMKAYLDGGGSVSDIDKMKLTAFGWGGIDLLGYMAETVTTADETILLTSEVLADALRLTHPDAHPPERQELAKRVTQQFLSLQPYVFPAEKPKPVKPAQCVDPEEAAVITSILEAHPAKPLRSGFLCAECASTIPLYTLSRFDNWRDSTEPEPPALKGDLAVRPIHHQEPWRIEAHIFIAFLAYCLHVTLGRRLKMLAPGLTSRSAFEKFAAIQMIDVNIPTADGRELQLTRTTQPQPELTLLLSRLRLELPNQPPPRITDAQAAAALSL